MRISDREFKTPTDLAHAMSEDNLTDGATVFYMCILNNPALLVGRDPNGIGFEQFRELIDKGYLVDEDNQP